LSRTVGELDIGDPDIVERFSLSIGQRACLAFRPPWLCAVAFAPGSRTRPLTGTWHGAPGGLVGMTGPAVQVTGLTSTWRLGLIEPRRGSRRRKTPAVLGSRRLHTSRTVASDSVWCETTMPRREQSGTERISQVVRGKVSVDLVPEGAVSHQGTVVMQSSAALVPLTDRKRGDLRDCNVDNAGVQRNTKAPMITTQSGNTQPCEPPVSAAVEPG